MTLNIRVFETMIEPLLYSYFSLMQFGVDVGILYGKLATKAIENMGYKAPTRHGEMENANSF